MESDNPKHYKKRIETWDAIISQLSPIEVVGYLKGSIAKTLFRSGSKGGTDIDKLIMDIKKSNAYINKLIEYLSKIKESGFDINELGINLLVKQKDKNEQ